MFIAKVKFNSEEIENELKRANEIIRELNMITMKLTSFLNLEISEVQSEENTSDENSILHQIENQAKLFETRIKRTQDICSLVK